MSRRIFYSPEENHLGVIYSERFGRRRFQRFVTEKENIIIGPRKITQRFVLKEIYLGPRTVQLSFPDMITQDQVHLEIDLKVFYRLDPRKTNADMLVQVLNSNPNVFEGIIRTNITEKLRNEIFIQKKISEIFSYQGRRALRKIVSSRLAERVRGFGITIHPLFGVAFMNIQPNAYYQKAMQEVAAAPLQGQAANQRIAQPPTQNPNEAISMLYAQTASAVAQTGTFPEHIYLHESGNGHLPTTRQQHTRRQQTAPKQGKTPEDEHPIPFAAD